MHLIDGRLPLSCARLQDILTFPVPPDVPILFDASIQHTGNIEI
jgi:hypothetical protein